MSASDDNAEIHIASFVVQHRDDAGDALAAAATACPELELALRGDIRSVVVCESPDRYAVMALVDRLQAVPGVLNVLLVYHHAEPRSALDQAIPDTTAIGVPP